MQFNCFSVCGCESGFAIPVQYHTGMLDKIQGFSDPHTAHTLTESMRKAGCEVELCVYEDTPHSFLNAMTAEGVAFLDKLVCVRVCVCCESAYVLRIGAA